MGSFAKKIYIRKIHHTLAQIYIILCVAEQKSIENYEFSFCWPRWQSAHENKSVHLETVRIIFERALALHLHGTSSVAISKKNIMCMCGCEHPKNRLQHSIPFYCILWCCVVMYHSQGFAERILCLLH